jgi:hypothetical protein
LSADILAKRAFDPEWLGFVLGQRKRGRDALVFNGDAEMVLVKFDQEVLPTLRFTCNNFLTLKTGA